MTVQVAVNLTPQQYRALAKIAGQRGVQAHHLVEQLVAHALKPVEAAAETEQLLAEIRRQHGQGRNDRQIAENLGAPRRTVTYHRNQMKLPANDNRGRKPQEKEVG